MNIRDFVKDSLAKVVTKAKTVFASKAEVPQVIDITNGLTAEIKAQVTAAPNSILRKSEFYYFPRDVVDFSIPDNYAHIEGGGQARMVIDWDELTYQIYPSSYASLASPVFTGAPTAPTVTPSTDSSTKIATTAFVAAAFGGQKAFVIKDTISGGNTGNYGALTPVAHSGGNVYIVTTAGKIDGVAVDVGDLVISKQLVVKATKSNYETVANKWMFLHCQCPQNHASSATTYGVGTTANYGHVKTQSGDMNGTSSTDGIAAGLGHTHSQYLSSASLTNHAQLADNILGAGHVIESTSNGYHWTLLRGGAKKDLSNANSQIMPKIAGAQTLTSSGSDKADMVFADVIRSPVSGMSYALPGTADNDAVADECDDFLAAQSAVDRKADKAGSSTQDFAAKKFSASGDSNGVAIDLLAGFIKSFRLGTQVLTTNNSAIDLTKSIALINGASNVTLDADAASGSFVLVVPFTSTTVTSVHGGGGGTAKIALFEGKGLGFYTGTSVYMNDGECVLFVKENTITKEGQTGYWMSIPVVQAY